MLTSIFFLGLVSSISAQVSIGGECWSSANGVASGGCASGTQCGPWLPDGGTWDGSSPWYCLATPKLASGATCDYATKNGLCDTGLTCCNGACASTCETTTEAPTTAAPTTTAAPITPGTNAAGQVTLGGECWSSANGVASGGCAPGTQCGPWLPDGGTWDGSSAWYCLALPKLASGATCDYSLKVGLCDTGLTCCSGACASTCDVTTTAAPTTTVAATTPGTNAAGQVTLGGECWSSANGVASGGCEPGTQCGPWLPNGGTWDGSSAWYCLAVPKLASGASCDYSDAIKRGLCDTGLTCCDNVCATSCGSTTTSSTTTSSTTTSTTTTSTTTSSTTTTSTTTSTTTTSTTTTSTTTTTTTTESCVNAGTQCMDMSTFTNIATCCEGLTCAPPMGQCS